MANDFIGITINDNTVKPGSSTPERTSFRIPVAPITDANLATIETQLGTLMTAVAGVTLGNVYKSQISITEENPDTPAANLLAQREMKWRVTMAGGGESKSFTIGTADLSLLEPNTEFMADNAARTALINALGNLVKASDGVTAMAVQLPIVFIGVNS